MLIKTERLIDFSDIISIWKICGFQFDATSIHVYFKKIKHVFNEANIVCYISHIIFELKF